MFHQMITRSRDRWLASPQCPVRELTNYIETTGQMRDAQIAAIKTYLFLKTACGCQPLARLFQAGRFNTLDLQSVPLSGPVRAYLEAHPAAAALLEYASLQGGGGERVSERLAELLSRAPESVDCCRFFHDAFYGLSYTDYLFSLPMGAGKTYLMAAFIYLDLYFAMREPQNPAFAHNFMIFAPSGLKSSVVPSLKTIQRFNPAWVLPEPAASAVRRALSFEVLDQDRSASRSNRTRNPNVQKIANHQPLPQLFGLVAVTNAEKVILQRAPEPDAQIRLAGTGGGADRQANELRTLIGRLPALSIFIDEVHHAVSDEIKLRAVVSRWAEGGTVNSVVGFSGTPYLERPEKIAVTDQLSVAAAGITNTVYYYPLAGGVGNFLKCPVVRISDTAGSSRIIEDGVREFLDTYGDTVYGDGTTAKLGIYCGSIEKLEELVYPLVSRIAGARGLPAGAVLKFHKGNRRYPQPADSQMHFDLLDSPRSRVRIVLLVQIGKEGWDCRSLTGIILSQEGDCPRNMVLQTACRCLRQVDRGQPETALIHLNGANGSKLIAQLRQRHHISLEEFTSPARSGAGLRRWDRTGALRLPKVAFYQLHLRTEAVILEHADPGRDIPAAAVRAAADVVKTTDFSLEHIVRRVDSGERGTVPAHFSQWLCGLTRTSLGALSPEDLSAYRSSLRTLFETITYTRDGRRFFSSRYDQSATAANVRKAFCDRRTCRTRMELVLEEASLLRTAGLAQALRGEELAACFPDQDTVERILLDDRGELRPDETTLQMLALAQQGGDAQILELLRRRTVSHPQKDRSFHYLPYRMDSGFERTFLEEALSLPEIERLDLEIYYNGDRAMTEFQIKCYRPTAAGWAYIGLYTPDFLILQRQGGEIRQVLITETKGEIYAGAPAFQARRTFLETEFLRRNNEAFGYERFAYLYLEDTLPQRERLARTQEKICAFFREEASGHAGEIRSFHS